MAGLTRETARRSINSLLDALPKEAVIELIRSGEPLVRTCALVKIEIIGPPERIQTSDAPDRKGEPNDAVPETG